MKPRRRKSTREPTIALINIVFLMLVFFMVAGTLAPPLDRDLTLVNTRDLDGAAPPDALVIHQDGRMAWRGTDMPSAAAFLAAAGAEGTTDEAPVVRIVPDRALPAERMIAVARDLRAAGAGRVMIVTERALE